MIYLDSAATTLQKPRSVAEATGRAVYSMASPGRGGHESAMRAADTVFKCRLSAARLFNVEQPESVVITFNATHALNIAIKSFAALETRAVISGYEHNAVVRPLYAAGARVFAVQTPLFQSDDFLEAFRKQLEQGAELAVCTHVSNAFGYILPIYEAAELCREYNVPLIIDASQSAGTLAIDFKRLGAAAVAMPGHKGLYGPQGTGLLLCGEGIRPLLEGGTGVNSIQKHMPEFLPERLEAGTYCLPGIAGLVEGLGFVRRQTPARIFAWEKELIKLLIDELTSIKGLTVYAAGEENRQGGVLSFRHESVDCETIAAKLAGKGIAVRAGLHCAPLAHETVGTLESGTVRVSVSAFNTKQEIEAFGKAVRDILK